VPIDTSVVESPGWWMKRLFGRLLETRRRYRLQLLLDYHRVCRVPAQGQEQLC
jgi:hypothetical protein